MSLYDLIKDPVVVTPLKGHKQAVLAVDFSRETNQVASGGEDNSVMLWNLPNIDDLPATIEYSDSDARADQPIRSYRSSNLLERMNDTSKPISARQISNVNKKDYISKRQSAFNEDVPHQEQQQTCYRLHGHKANIMSVAFGCGYLVSASRDGQTKLWKMDSSLISSNPEYYSYSSHSATVRSVACSLDSPLFCTASDDKSIKVWSANSQNKMVQSFTNGHKNWIKCVKWSKRNPHLIASCGDDGLLCIWDTKMPSRQPPIDIIAACRKGMHFNCLDWHPIFDYNIATGAKDSTCIVWDLRMKKQIQLYSEHELAVNSVAFNEGGNFLISGSSDTTTKMFDILEGRLVFTLKAHNGPVNSVAFNTTGDLFATASNDKTVIIWKSNIEPCSIVADEEDQSVLLIDNNIGYVDSEDPTSVQSDLYTTAKVCSHHTENEALVQKESKSKNNAHETNTKSCSCKKATSESVTESGNRELLSQILNKLNFLCIQMNSMDQRILGLEQTLSTKQKAPNWPNRPFL